MATVCIGDEFVVDGTGRLRLNVANGTSHTVATAPWPYSAADPAASSNSLHYDSALGLWVHPPAASGAVSVSGTTTAGAGAVPSVATTIASPAITVTNPSSVRPAQILQRLSVDVIWSLPAGAGATITCICESDEWLHLANPAPAAGTAMTACHSRYVRDLTDGNLAPGETRTITRDLSIKGTGGATWSSALWNNKVMMVTL